MSAAETREGPAPPECDHFDGAYFRSVSLAEQAAQYLEGEDYARAFLERLHAETAQPDDMAVLAGFLHGPMLKGFCRVIVKAIGGRR